MKLNDLLMKMSEQDFITLVVDVCGVDFEANVRAGDIPKVLADTLVIHMSARDDQLRVVMEKGGDCCGILQAESGHDTAEKQCRPVWYSGIPYSV